MKKVFDTLAKFKIQITDFIQQKNINSNNKNIINYYFSSVVNIIEKQPQKLDYRSTSGKSSNKKIK